MLLHRAVLINSILYFYFLNLQITLLAYIYITAALALTLCKEKHGRWRMYA